VFQTEEEKEIVLQVTGDKKIVSDMFPPIIAMPASTVTPK